MPKVSINILTKNRVELLKKALDSVLNQNFTDFEIIVVNDGSADETEKVLQGYKDIRIQIVKHQTSLGITKSRQEALEKSTGEYIAILDDDDEWVDADKLGKQVRFLDTNKDCVLVGGGIELVTCNELRVTRQRPEIDEKIRNTMLFRNNFFTSTVMFRKNVAVKVGGFIKDQDDFAEDYDLWLRMGKLGEMYNFQEVFTAYRVPNYNKARLKAFLEKQLRLIKVYKANYPYYFFSSLVLKLRLI